ncbi:amino acid adenylation domain-containing protein [Streptomyces caelestis]|uniref:amino acid adenylation domain-containing protein n=1 Tax=Streptomyces caelestis TaxID=36816 RepID=UPI0036F55A1D
MLPDANGPEALPTADTAGLLDLTRAQRGIWYGQQLDPGNPAYNTGEYLEIHGPLDPELFETALRRVIAEAETFRLRFVETGDGPRCRVSPAVDCKPHLLDVSAEPDPQAAAEEWIRSDLATPADLTEGPLFTQALFKAADDRWFWYQRAHHILLDGYSYLLVFRQVAEVYTALAKGHDTAGSFPPVHTLLDEETSYRAGQRFERDRAYWTERFADAPEAVGLTEGTAQPSASHLRCATTLSAAEAERLSAAAARLGVGRTELFLAAVGAYVHRVTGAPDVVLGLTTLSRLGTAPLRTPGTTSNNLPLRLDVQRDTPVGELVRSVAADLRAVRAHQQYRGEDLRRDLKLLGGTRRLYGPLVNLVFFHHDVRFGDFATTPHHLSGGAVEDLSITVRPGPGGAGLLLAFDANPALYTQDQLAEHQERFLLLLGQLADAEPDMSLARTTLLRSGEEPAHTPAEPMPAAPGTTLPQLFEAQAARTPQAVAVTHEGTSIGYAELNARANRLARLLVGRGAGPGRIVALALHRSPELIVGILAVLKSGAAYLPLDPGYPAERIRLVAEDASPALLVTDAHTAPELPDVGAPVVVLGDPGTDQELAACSDVDLTDADRPAPLAPEDIAYIIYTSGSTGRPKGVAIPHSNVISLFRGASAHFTFTGDDVWPLFHSYAFDVSVWEMWGALLHGGRLVVVPHTVTRSPGEFLDLLRRERVTVLNQTPSAFRQLVEADREAHRDGHDHEPFALRYIVFAGEALNFAQLRPWVERYGDEAPVLVNMYGITETTVHSTYQRVTREMVTADRGRSAIGTALPHLRVYVLDHCGQHAPPGWVGEIHVAGQGLAQGYLGRPDLTAERFVDDPFGRPGELMYRSGDLARRLADGTLEFVGRRDHQVKIRGFRIEPGEIEVVLADHPGVTQAAVVVRERAEVEDRILVAYAVPEPGHRPDAAELRGHLARRLPEHMVPSACVVVDRLPLTPNGKLDVAALPAPDFAGTAGAGRGPAGESEKRLCELFEQVLGLSAGAVGPDDDFFDLGGHSVLATRLQTRIRAAFDAEIGMAAIFEAASPGALAALLAEHAADATAQGDAGAARPPLVPAVRPEHVPLSPAQARIWFLNRLEGPSPTYHIPLVLSLRTAPDADTLRAALADVCTRHEALRTVFPDVEGDPRQVVLDPDSPQARPVLEVADVAATDLASRVRSAARQGFDLSAQIPLRAHLFRADDSTTALLLVLHHIAGDGWSLVPLAQDLAEAYTARAEGRVPDWQPLPVQYADYTLWQRELLGDPADADSRAGRQLAYWQRTLAAAPEQLDLPYDRLRTRTHQYAGDAVPVGLDADLHRKLSELAGAHRTTVFMVLQAALAATLARSGAGPDIPLGTAVAGRHDAALDHLVGFFSNTLVLRTDTSGDPSFEELLERVRKDNLAAQAHQDLPFDWLVDRLAPPRVAGRHPLFQVMLVLQNAGDATLEMEGSTLRLEPTDVGVSRFDLTLSLAERRGEAGEPAGVAGSVEYSTELFERATVEALVERLRAVLARAVAASDRPLSQLLPDGETRQHLQDSLPGCERALLAQDGVRECLVSLRTSATGVPEPVAYVVPEAPVDPAALAVAGRAALPPTAPPLRVVPVTAVPRTAQGVVDTEALLALPVLDEGVARAWERRLTADPDVTGAAVAVRDRVPPAPGRLHIGDLLTPSRTAPEPTPGTEGVNPDRQTPLSISEGPALRLLPQRTLADALAAAEAGHGEVVHIRPDGSEERQSYAELAEDASRVLHGLRQAGLRAGDKVLFQLPDTRDFVVGFWACALGGMVPVPLAAPPAGYAHGGAQVTRLVDAWTMLDGPCVLAPASARDAIRMLLAEQNGGPEPQVAAVDDLLTGPRDRDWHPADPDDLALLLLTSGSTGKPKAVEQRHRNLLAHVAAAVQQHGLTADDVSFNWMPLDHVGGVVMFHLRDVVLGARQVLAPTAWVLEEPLRWLDAIDRHRAASTWAPNFAYGLVADRLAAAPDHDWDLSCLRLALNGGEGLAARVARRFLSELRPFGLPATAMHPVWGMSETSSGETDAVLTLDGSSDDDPHVSCGRPYPGFAIRIVADSGEALPEGETGRMQVRGPMVTDGYHRAPEHNAEAFTADGWFDTGDLAFLRDGAVTLTGRAKDVIIVNGVNHPSQAVEGAVEEIDGVERSFTAAVAVRGSADATTDELAVFCVPAPGSDRRGLVAAITGRVTREFGVTPAHVLPVCRQDIPKTEIGKIQRALLRKRFEDGLYADVLRDTDVLLGNERTVPDWFHRPVWLRAERVHGTDPRAAAGQVLLVAEPGCPLLEPLARRIAASGGTSSVVTPPASGSLTPQAWTTTLTPAFEGPVNRVVDLTMAGPAEPDSRDPGRLPADARRMAALIGAMAALAGDERRITLDVVAVAGCQIRQDEPVYPARAAAVAVLKSALQELPWLDGRWTDLDGADAAQRPDLTAAAVLDEIVTPPSEPVVALRDGTRWVNRLMALPVPRPDDDGVPPFREGGHYLITGGLGGLGVEVARTLLTDHRARLTLIGRGPLQSTSGRAEALAELRALGDVRYVGADLADPDAVRRALADAESAAGRVDGVLHLAGHFAERPLTDGDGQHWQAVLAAKTTGAAVLTDLLRDRPGTLFVSFSSVNGHFGGAFAAAYAAANACVDALAAQQRSLGLRAYSVAWSMWDEIGASRGYALKDLTRARGFRLIGRQDGMRSLTVALRHDPGHVLIGLDPGAPWVRSHLDTPTETLRMLEAHVTGKDPGEPTAATEPDRFGTPVPCAVRQVDVLPARSGGRAAGGPDATEPDGGEPATPLEQALARVWCELLGVERIGRNDNFFALGGHSLLAARLVGRIRAAEGLELSVADLFAAPTLAELAECAAAGRPRPPLVREQRPDPMPLSPAQTRLWFIDRLEGPSPTYNIPVVLRFPGPVDSDVLRSALSDVVARHEALRTRFPERDGAPVQEVLNAAEAEADLFVAQTPPRLLQDQLRSAARMGFQLESDLPLRAHLFQLPDGSCVLLLVLHHIAADGWSLAPLAADLSAAYRARAEGCAPQWDDLPVQYGDYALWQRRLLGDPDDPDSTAAQQFAYWAEQLAGLPDELDLPYDRPRPDTPSRQGRLIHRRLDGALHRRLTELARNHEATLFMVVQAALAAALTRSGAGGDIPVGTVLAGRSDPALSPLVGFFVNTQVLRTRTSGDLAFAELLNRVRDTTKAAHAHQDLPFDHLVERLNPPRHLARHPLFQISLTFEDAAAQEVELAGTRARIERLHLDAAKFDLVFNFSEHRDADGTPDGLDLNVEYSVDLFDSGTAEELADLVGRVLRDAAGDPSRRLSELAAAEPAPAGGEGPGPDDAALTAAVLAVPGVRECAVARRRDADGRLRPVVHAVPERPLTASRLAEAAHRALPALPAPPLVVLVTALPRTPDGTVDAEALDRLPVLDGSLITAWRDRLLAVPAVESATVTVAPVPLPPRPETGPDAAPALLHPVWHPARPAPAQPVVAGAEVAVLAGRDRRTAEELAELIRRHGGRGTVLDGAADGSPLEGLRALPAPPDRVIDLTRLDDDAPAADVPDAADPLGGLLDLITALSGIDGAPRTTALTVAARTGPRPRPDHAACVALLMSAAQEQPGLAARWIEVRTADAGPARLAERLFAELAPGAEAHVALDGDRRWVSRLAELPPESAASRPSAAVIEPGGHHLVTGGLGGTGVELARHLLTRYGARLTLVGRTPAERHLRRDVLAELRALGDVRYLAADIADAEEVRRLLAEAGEPDAVWHLAGHLADGPVTEATPEQRQAVWQAKVAGARHLTEALGHRRGMLFVSFSSVNGYFGGARTGLYAAANAWLDALAVHQRRMGLRGHSLAWSMWEETGMSRGYALRELTEARGYRVLPPRQALAGLDAALRHDTPHLLIGPDPAAPWVRAHLPGPALPLERLAATVTTRAGHPVPAVAEAALPDPFGTPTPCAVRVGEAAQAQDAPAGGRADELLPALTAIWAETLGREQVGPDDSFFDLGGHSILLVNLRSLIQRRLGHDVSLADVFSHPAPAAMARHLASAGEPAAGDRGDPAAGAQRAVRQKQARARNRAAAQRKAHRDG